MQDIHPQLLVLIARGSCLDGLNRPNRQQIRGVIRNVLVDHQVSAKWCLRWNRDADGVNCGTGYIWMSSAEAVQVLLHPDPEVVGRFGKLTERNVYQYISYKQDYRRVEKMLDCFSGNSLFSSLSSGTLSNSTIEPRQKYPSLPNIESIFELRQCRLCLPSPGRSYLLICRGKSNKALDKWITADLLYEEANKYNTSRRKPRTEEIERYSDPLPRPNSIWSSILSALSLDKSKETEADVSQSYQRRNQSSETKSIDEPIQRDGVTYPLVKLMERSYHHDGNTRASFSDTVTTSPLDERFAIIYFDPDTTDPHFALLMMKSFTVSRGGRPNQEIITVLKRL
jgi:hypothetical protein